MDQDSGENGRLTYSITEGNRAGYFMIDSVTGDIVTEMKMDRETQDRYALTVLATDHVSTQLIYITFTVISEN